MKALFIGGTGTISSAITRELAARPEWELTLLNRGNRNAEVPENVHVIQADIRNEDEVAQRLEGLQFDVVADFIGFTPDQLERDWRLFHGRTRQFFYISSASAYQKPLSSPIITEGTPLANPYWQYSRDKIACEELLMKHYRDDGFPITIIRPSHTYCERSVPVAIHGSKGSGQVLRRIMEGKPVIVPGDGTTLWTVTHNTDFARAFVGLMANPHALGEVFHLTSDEHLTWNQIIQTVAHALGREAKLYHVASDFLAAVGEQYDMEGNLLGDKANTVIFDNSKLKRAVPGWCATIPFHLGAQWAVDYMLAHPDLCMAEDLEFDAWCDAIIAAQEAAKTNVGRAYGKA